MSRGRNSWVTRIEVGYGFFPGGDPRKFSPDAESCTEEEIAAHKVACEVWERGEQQHEPHQGCRASGRAIVCGGEFGIGMYEYEVVEPPDTRYWRRRSLYHARMGAKLVDRRMRELECWHRKVKRNKAAALASLEQELRAAGALS